MANEYRWDQQARRFRGPNGRFVHQSTIKAMKNRIIAAESAAAQTLAARAVTGEIGMDTFVRDMRTLVKRQVVMTYMLGRGGRNAMTNRDRGRLGGLLKHQYQFINRFADDLNHERISEAQARSRATMYIEYSRGAYDRGYAAAWDADLPAYPGDGGTVCLSRCKCSWDIGEHGKGANREIRAYWRVNSANPCPGCEERSIAYSPHRIPRPGSEG